MPRPPSRSWSLILQDLLGFEVGAASDEPARRPSQWPAAKKSASRLLAGAVGQELELAQAAAQRYMDVQPQRHRQRLDTPDMVQDRLGLYLQFFEAQSPRSTSTRST